MNILAIETSTDHASLALLYKGALTSFAFTSPPAHSATILPALRGLLDEAGLCLSQLDGIACGVGPGAFTGVRLACSVAQGLALGADLPVAQIVSLLALAEEAGAQQVYCAMDARMGEAYVALYQRLNEGWQALIEPCCVKPDALPGYNAAAFVLAGNAIESYPEIETRLGTSLIARSAVRVPAAQSIAKLAVDALWQDAAMLAPLYVRDRVAQTIAERIAVGGRA